MRSSSTLQRFSLAFCASLLFAACAADSPTEGATADNVGSTTSGQTDAGATDSSDTGTSGSDTGGSDTGGSDTTGTESGGDSGTGQTGVDDTLRPEGWTVETHSKEAAPNLDEVFSDTEVKRIDIVFSPQEWETMMQDMTDIYGEPGVGGGGPGGGGPGGGGPGGGGPGGGGPGGFSDQDPVFVPADIHYGDHRWTEVGVRFKGNSSLKSTWSSGNLKLSFKLDFDEFEDQYPEIDDQRFFGFKKLSLKNNYADPSFVREKVMADVFADAQMIVSRTGFYAVYVDRGDGPEYFGLYTMVEEPDDTVFETQLGSDKGNLYKPDGAAATFAQGSFDEVQMDKKNNEDEADFSDVLALHAALHADTRTTDPKAWRDALDAVFDTDVFLQYLAVNGIGQNWDTYGRMTHNYYLYQVPESGRLTWIPWDNNESLQTGKQGGSLPLDFAGLNSATWPLIGYLYADPVYRATYEQYLQETIDGPFSVAAMHARYDAYQELIRPYATTELPGSTFLSSAQAFETAFDTLRNHAQQRVGAAQSYLGQ